MATSNFPAFTGFNNVPQKNRISRSAVVLKRSNPSSLEVKTLAKGTDNSKRDKPMSYLSPRSQIDDFKQLMNDYKRTFYIAHPTHGALAVIQDQIKSGSIQFSNDDCKRLKEGQVNAAINNLSNLPRYGLVACNAAFEAYMHDIFDLTLDTLFEANENGFKDFETIYSKNTKVDLFKTAYESKLATLLNDYYLQKSEATVRRIIDDCAAQKTLCSSCASNKNNSARVKPKELFDFMMNPSTKINHPEVVDILYSQLKERMREPLRSLERPTTDFIFDTVQQVFLGSDGFKTAAKNMYKTCMTYAEEDNEMQAWIVRNDKDKGNRFHLDDSDIRELVSDDQGELLLEFTFKGTKGRPDCTYQYALNEDDREDLALTYRQSAGFWLNSSNNVNYFIKPDDLPTMINLSKLFYGLRNLSAHGNVEKTLRKGGGALGDIPNSLQLTAIKKQQKRNLEDQKLITELIDSRRPKTREAADISTQCEKTLLDLWREAVNKKTRVDISFAEFGTAHQFYIYYAHCLNRMMACLIYKLIDVDNPYGWCGMTRTSMEDISESMRELVKDTSREQICRKGFNCTKRKCNAHTLEQMKYFEECERKGKLNENGLYKSKKCAYDKCCYNKTTYLCFYKHKSDQWFCYNHRVCTSDHDPDNCPLNAVQAPVVP